MLKLCFVDVETGGTDLKKSALLQLSGKIQIDGEDKETFDYFIQPFPGDQFEVEALKVNGISEKDVLFSMQGVENPDPNAQFFEKPQVIYRTLVKTLGKYVDKYNKKDKFYFIGYNSNSFDMPILREFFNKNGDVYFGSWFWYPSIDVMPLWAFLLREYRTQLPDFKLHTVAKFAQLTVDETKLHDAQYDIMLTEQLYLLGARIIELGFNAYNAE